ncbi:hypothetical protein TRV_05079 [Trichophyton verrucosum HKI 0517]|uniref:Uncharacterized protein n=1 Tax=Trichophyton verrucosum (strain HKI 0517) TaxID=663202 RepID=D4DD72_TRIVH|nr:uncharacterized protein TRV_05079 [Trichophyton verrucosum HKI 0517]EFE40235.1 hypothetical protein TRV_05079 [Trichophyton verrucosum HKI 0517]
MTRASKEKSRITSVWKGNNYAEQKLQQERKPPVGRYVWRDESSKYNHNSFDESLGAKDITPDVILRLGEAPSSSSSHPPYPLSLAK